MVQQLGAEEEFGVAIPVAPEITMDVKVEEIKDDDSERPKGKFLVKQLATKFETSPVDPQPPFEFGKANSGAFLLRRDNSQGAMNRPDTDRNRMTIPASGPVAVVVAKSSTAGSPRAIARSLDENAFVREFGSVKILDKFPGLINEEKPQLQENNQNSENINGTTRRSGGSDYAKPKSLNPPKKLPLLEGVTASVPAAVVQENNGK